ncbi:MAG: TolC family protein [Burkholderiaceae bacterium]
MTRPSKRLSYRASLVLATGLLAASPAFGYNLEQAYRDALSHDAELNSARASLEISRHRVPQARSQLRPAVSANAGINRQYVDTNVSASNGFTSQNYGISMSYPLLARQDAEAMSRPSCSSAWPRRSSWWPSRT